MLLLPVPCKRGTDQGLPMLVAGQSLGIPKLGFPAPISPLPDPKHPHTHPHSPWGTASSGAPKAPSPHPGNLMSPHIQCALCPCSGHGDRDKVKGAKSRTPQQPRPTRVPRLRGTLAAPHDGGRASVPHPTHGQGRSSPSSRAVPSSSSSNNNPPILPTLLPCPQGGSNTAGGWAGSCRQPMGCSWTRRGVALCQTPPPPPPPHRHIWMPFPPPPGWVLMPCSSRAWGGGSRVGPRCHGRALPRGKSGCPKDWGLGAGCWGCPSAPTTPARCSAASVL